MLSGDASGEGAGDTSGLVTGEAAGGSVSAEGAFAQEAKITAKQESATHRTSAMR